MRKSKAQKPVLNHRPLLPAGTTHGFHEDNEMFSGWRLQEQHSSIILPHIEAEAEQYTEWPIEFLFLQIRSSEVSTDIAQAIASSFVQRMSYSSTIERRLSVLEEKVVNLQEELASRPVVKNATLHDLHIEGYKLKSPIQILIEEYEDECVARFPEIEVFGSGDTEPEAVANLRNEIIVLYKDLKTSNDDQLGKLPRAWRRILAKLITEDGETEFQS